MRIKRAEILAVYAEGPGAVVRLVESLIATAGAQSEQIAELSGRIERQLEKIKELGERVALLEGENGRLIERVGDLEARLKLNSRNSSKPPSTDGFAKPPQKRKKTGKPPGGQAGHPGHTLEMAENPDHVVVHPVSTCSCCGRSLERVGACTHERRQVFELPPMRMEVTEHRAERKTCPRCGVLNRAAFPEGVDQPTQYGHRARATAVYLNQYQLIPYERTGEVFSDLFGCDISEGTLVNWNSTAAEILRPVEDEIKRQIACSPVAGFDETGMRVEGKGAWLHVASTEELTHYGAHEKRGRAAMDDIGILPDFRGTAVHDCWSPYLTYDCSHALCCAHLVRELAFQEECGQEWASDMIDLLFKAYAAVSEAKAGGSKKLKRPEKEKIEERYELILEEGFAANPLPDARGQPKKRGRKKKSKVRNLLERLRDRQSEVLAFMHDFSVPFDNNLAERDLRMAKVKQKISGTFRSWDGAGDFGRIRGYISTARKNQVPVIRALADVFEGKPFMPVPVET